MAKKKTGGRIWWLALVPAVLAVLGIIFVRASDFAVLDPHGQIAQQERNLLAITVALGLLVIVPVFIMSYTIAWRYREGNKKATYNPDFDHNTLIESIWWGIPCAIILTLAIIAWNSAHSLDPFKKLDSNVRPLHVQVVALQWRWLFIYPEQNIATLNYLELPVNRPVDFDITSDAPMNSFWIPRLGGQIYAMSGMSTQLHLMAGKAGDYRGSSANISGKGFADMTFQARAVNQASFDKWVARIQASTGQLDIQQYLDISAPATDKTEMAYSGVAPGLYDDIIMKYMSPGMNLQEISDAR
jgi:cytochrome o ubiquinol oxidase subunit 2